MPADASAGRDGPSEVPTCMDAPCNRWRTGGAPKQALALENSTTGVAEAPGGQTALADASSFRCSSL